MKRFTTLLLFIFTAVIARSQQSKAVDLPPLLSKLEQSKRDTSRIGILIQLAEYYLGRERVSTRMDSVAAYLKKAQDLNNIFHIATFQNRISLLTAIRHTTLNPSVDPSSIFLPVVDSCRKTRDRKNEADAWSRLGAVMPWDSLSLIYRVTYYQNSLILARQLQNNYMEIELLANIGLLHIYQHKYKLAEQELLQLLKEEKKASPGNIITVNFNLSNLYFAKLEYDKSLRYALKARQIMEDSGDSSSAQSILYQLAYLYRILGKPVERLEWDKNSLDYEMAIYIAGTYDRFEYITKKLRALGKPQQALDFIMKLISQKKPTKINEQRLIQRALGDTYNALGKYDLAEKSYVEMIMLGDEQGKDIIAADKSYDNGIIGIFYFRRGNYRRALPFFEIALKSSEEWGQIAETRTDHLWLFRTDSALENYVSAIRHLKNYNRLGDSIFNIARNKQIEELQITYKTEQNAKDFRLLQGKEQLGQVQLQSTKNTRNWIIAGASLLLMIAGLLYRLAALRKNKNVIIRKQNGQLKDLITEKEWLLKEVHHRVKNNLHTVIGLLESQAAYLQDDALKANEISKHRIYAMSLIHQQLYNAEDIKTIDMAVYLPELLDYLADGFGIGRRIRFQLDIAPLKLGVSQAIPIGLIVNEAVTNSIKYAFGAGKQGSINISMHQSDDRINLVIADDGIGINPAITSTVSTSMGLKLMRGLTRDIDGEINITNENGTRIAISFHPDPLNEISSISKEHLVS